MKLHAKPDWEQTGRRLKAFWHLEIIDRPVVQVTAPRNPGGPRNWTRILDGEAQANPERIERELISAWDSILFLGDAYPTVYPNFGPGALTAFMGAPIYYDNARSTSWQDDAVYHLDGPGAVKHLDALLEIRNFKAIQWTAGAGQPAMPYWIPMFKRIQGAGKGLVIYAEPSDLQPLMAELRPEGVILMMTAPDSASAEAIVNTVSRWR